MFFEGFRAIEGQVTIKEAGPNGTAPPPPPPPFKKRIDLKTRGGALIINSPKRFTLAKPRSILGIKGIFGCKGIRREPQPLKTL